ncbi:MAG: helix-turn-helix transcriptional regulator [Bacteroidales bacterium]|jgi:DNA-binding NarL/FixJ family response regulator|nr:helix-turn-helix transcriptional regulator [Bacteroidales bacterium]MBR6929472.1 helix-turn-helix transcriptional regulator [Bacteroidales bacterium]
MRNRVIICEASEIIVNGLAEIIDGMAQFDVVMRLDNPERLSERILSTDANLLIINPLLLGYQNRSFLAQLGKEHPNVTLIALVTSYLDHAMLTPYSGVIEINDTRAKIISKMNEFAQSETTKSTDDVELSKRETDVLVAVAKGMMNKEIADQMNISIHTVISHRKNITRKTGIKSISGLTVYALLNNLISEDELI